MESDASGLENSRHMPYGTTDPIDMLQKCTRQDEVNRPVWHWQTSRDISSVRLRNIAVQRKLFGRNVDRN